MSQVTIRGKAVEVRESFKGKEWYALPGLYRRAWRAAAAGDYAPVIAFLAAVITSWEFEGAPADEAAYEQFDVLGELMVMADGALLAVRAAAFPPSDVGG